MAPGQTILKRQNNPDVCKKYIIMKKILILLLLPVTCFAQKPKGYGLVGGSINFFEGAKNSIAPGARLTFGIMPQKNVGFGPEFQWVVDSRLCIMGDFRFISNKVGPGSITVAVKPGSSLGSNAFKGGFAFGAEAGYIFGKNMKGFCLSGQYLTARSSNKLYGTFIVDNIISIMFGARF